MTKNAAAKRSKVSTPMWRVLQAEPQLWVVGFTDSGDRWHPVSDWPTYGAALDRAHQLNGRLGLYVYQQTGESLWSCGYYTFNLWHPTSDHGSPEEAANKVIALNNGQTANNTPSTDANSHPATQPGPLGSTIKLWAGGLPGSSLDEHLGAREPSEEILYHLEVVELDEPTGLQQRVVDELELVEEWPVLAAIVLCAHPADHLELTLEVGLVNIKLSKS